MGLESCIMASLLALACQTNVERAGQLVSFELSHSCLVSCQILKQGRSPVHSCVLCILNSYISGLAGEPHMHACC